MCAGDDVVAAYAEDLQLRNAKATSIRICVRETHRTAPEQVASDTTLLIPQGCNITAKYHCAESQSLDDRFQKEFTYLRVRECTSVSRDERSVIVVILEHRRLKEQLGSFSLYRRPLIQLTWQRMSEQLPSLLHRV